MSKQTAVTGDVFEELEGEKAQPEIDRRVEDQEQDIAGRELKEGELADHHLADETCAQR